MAKSILFGRLVVMGEIWLLATLLISYEIRKIGVCRREGGDLYNGDADAEDPAEGSKKRKKKVTKKQ